MPRFARRAALASLFVTAPATVFAQSTAPDAALRPRSTDRLPTVVETPALDAASADPLTNEQLASRLSRLYARQSELLAAEAAGQSTRYVEILDAMVMDLRLLSDAPGVRQQPRFREAYTAIMSEQEAYYNAPELDRGEIYAFRDAVFAATDAVDGPLLEDVRIAIPQTVREAPGPYVAVFPMTVNRAVEGSLRYMRRASGHTARLRSRADTYFPMVERILAEEGVPDELKYLAMVESALNPRARSHAGAAGMWQFIRATGAAYGLEVTDDVDDRLDPEESTRAAARHLRDLYERFGDWQLALAGYNCNPARIARELRAAEGRLGRRATFWDIYENIPRETRNYVPMFIATALVISNPDAYDLPAAERGPRYVYDTVPVAGGTRLSEVAGIVGADVEALRALNPQLRRERAPGSPRDAFMLRVPQGSYDVHMAALDRLAPRAAQGSTLYAARTVNYGPRAQHTLTPGDGQTELVAAATPRRTSGSEDRLAEAARRLSEERGGSRGARETAPEPEPEPLVAAAPSAPVRTASERREETAEARPAARPPARERRREEARPAARPARPTTHRVARGENLTALASRYDVTVRQLREWNDIEGSNIRPGQRLRISADAPGARQAAAASTRPSTMTHRVASGENLTGIARRYGVTVRQVREWNNLSGETIRPGQRLRIEQPRRSVG